MRSVLFVVGALVFGSGCLEFTDKSHLEGYCFNEVTGRYQLCLADAAAADAGDSGEHPDASSMDADLVDVGEPDSGVWPDAEPTDSGEHPDAEPVDTGSADSGGHPDAEPMDAELIDAGQPDSGVWPDAEPVDMGQPDSGVWPDAAPADTGPADSGVHPDAAVPMRIVEVRISGNASGVVRSMTPGLDCQYYAGSGQSGLCLAAFPAGSAVVLGAVTSWQFVGWGGACASYGNGLLCQLDLTAPGDRVVLATFD